MNIESYIAHHINAWSPATIKSERSRLKAFERFINGNPLTLWEALQSKKPYTRVTVYTRVVDYWQFLNPGSVNPYKVWREKNANYFKNAYSRSRPALSYEEAVQKIKEVGDIRVRTLALDIIASGTRVSEAMQPKGTGYIVGKGAKVRTDLRPQDTPAVTISYYEFWKSLKKHTGLKPHDLRKLALTKAAEAGAQAQDLMEIAGWSSINTASYYLQPKRKEVLKGFLK